MSTAIDTATGSPGSTTFHDDHRGQSAGPATARARAALDRNLVRLLALACGLTIANLYYAQPLLHSIAASLHVSQGTGGTIVLATQIGYAAGLVLLVPLGDLLQRRRLIPALVALTGLGCLGVTAAPSAPVLLIAITAMGLTAAVVQMIVPLAATLAAEHERGKVVGQVMSGLLCGILLARTMAGVVAQAAGWRFVFVLAAAMMLILSLALASRLPSVPATANSGYRRLLGSVIVIVREERELRRRMLYGALGMAGFATLWTPLAFLLAAAPYRYGEATIGLFGLAGAVGALAARVAGRLADRGHGALAAAAFAASVLIAWGMLALGANMLAALIVGIVLLDLGVQGMHIVNQSVVYALRPEARSRLTTAYMGAFFLGAAAGSGGSVLAFSAGGWPATCVLGAAIAATALSLISIRGLAERRR